MDEIFPYQIYLLPISKCKIKDKISNSECRELILSGFDSIAKTSTISFSEPRLMAQHMPGMHQGMRSPTPQGAPIILAPRMQALGSPGLVNGGPPPLVSPAEAGLIYPYEYPYGLAPTALLEYPGVDQSAAGTSYVR